MRIAERGVGVGESEVLNLYLNNGVYTVNLYEKRDQAVI